MSIPTGDKHGEHEKRAAFISDLRALADLLENEPRLPVPYDMTGVAYLDGTPAEKLATLFTLAQLLDTEVTYRPHDGVCESWYTRGKVRYDLYASIDKPPTRPDGKLVVTSPSQVFTTTTSARPDLAKPAADAEPLINGEQFAVDDAAGGDPS